MRRMTSREKDIARAQIRVSRAEAAYQRMLRRHEQEARAQEARR